MILAAVATGQNPRCFGVSGGRLDLRNVMVADYDTKTGQYGKSAFDHALAILALKASHETIPKRAVTFATGKRGKYG